MSETTDPTAGEADEVAQPGPGPFTDEDGNAYPPKLTVVTPADPDAGDVDLSNLCSAFDRHRYDTHDWCLTHDVDVQPDAMCPVTAALLDAVRRKAGDERAEQIAQAIEAQTTTFVLDVDLDAYACRVLAVAVRIAREPR